MYLTGSYSKMTPKYVLSANTPKYDRRGTRHCMWAGEVVGEVVGKVVGVPGTYLTGGTYSKRGLTGLCGARGHHQIYISGLSCAG